MSRHGWAIVDAVAGEAIRQEKTRTAFLAARMRKPSWGSGRCTGISSDALALYGLGDPEPKSTWNYPADFSDLAACERTYRMAPDAVRARMLPLLEKYRDHVAVRWPNCPRTGAAS